MIFQKPV